MISISITKLPNEAYRPYDSTGARAPWSRWLVELATSIDPLRSTLALRLTPNDQLRSTWAPRRTPNDPLRSTLDRFCDRFWSFFEGRSCDQLDVQHDVPNLRFCWHARYFGGFARIATMPKSNTFRRRKTPTMVRERAMRANCRVRRSPPRLGVDFGRFGAPPDAPGRSPRANSSDLGRLDRPRSTHFDRLGCLDRLRNAHFDRLGRISGQLSASLRSCEVSSFPAALSSPSSQADLARYRASLPRSAHQPYD